VARPVDLIELAGGELFVKVVGRILSDPLNSLGLLVVAPKKQQRGCREDERAPHPAGQRTIQAARAGDDVHPALTTRRSISARHLWCQERLLRARVVSGRK